jgi:hypothetical protein
LIAISPREAPRNLGNSMETGWNHIVRWSAREFA